MNSVKVAAALRALADAVEEGAPASETLPEPAAPAKRKAATKPAQPAASDAAAAPAPAAAAPNPPPAAPPISIAKLNKAVLAVAAVDRDKAIALLGKFGVTGTPALPAEKYQVVFDAFEEEKAKMDAASVQGSLV